MRTKLLYLSAVFLFTSLSLFGQVTSCLTNSVDGYASVSGEGLTSTTGGAGGAVVNISTLSQLEAWVASRENNSTSQVVYINGLIEQPGTTSLVLTIKRGGNVSIIGNTVDAGLKNIGLNFREYTNVIIRNMTVREVFYPNDGITIDNCHHVWIDHCDLYSKNGAGIGVDTYDGLLDIKNGSHNVTISWNRLHSHKKVNLLGHTDNTAQESTDRNIRVTFHHNYYYDNDGRNPSVRWGAAHVYNNYYKDIYDYGIAIRQGGHALVENNIYDNVKTPISTNKFTGEGIVCERGNVFTNCGASSITQTDCNWWNSSTLTYNYSLTPTNELIGILTSQTGTCSQVGPPTNQSPTVAITSPANSTTYTAPANISITATADDADGTVTKVDFYNGSTLLTSDASAPYTHDWNGLPAGTYVLTARATDNSGAETTSTIVTVIVNNPSPTGYTLQAETACTVDGILDENKNVGFNGSGYVNLDNVVGSSATWTVNSPSAQEISLSIRYSNGGANNRSMSIEVNGTIQIANQDFLSTGDFTTWNRATAQITLAAGYNTVNLTSLTSEGAPNIDELTFSATNVSAASCTAPVSPEVSLTFPSSNSSFCQGLSVAIAATASDADGTINKVEFFNGANLLATVTSAPYTYSWTNAAAGTYSITARATDNNGNTSTSGASSITIYAIPSAPSVTTPLTFCQNSSADRLTASGSNLKWYTEPSNGTGSSTAPTPETGVFGTSNHYVSQTVNGCESPRATIAVTIHAIPSAPSVTTPLTFCQNSSADRLTASGSNLKWYTEPSNGISSTTAPTPGTGAIGTTNYYVSQTVNECESPRALMAVIVDARPTATISAGGPTTFTQGGNVLLSANTGVGLSYIWFNGNTQVGMNASYTASTSGNYTVVVTNAANCDATSEVTTVTVSDNLSPLIVLTSPVSNESFIETAAITIAATATDPDGTIAMVEFYSGATLLGSDNNSPYTYTWTGVQSGSYTLTAKAIDNLGNEKISLPISIVVGVNQPSVIAITSPLDNSTLNTNSITISGTVTDPDGSITLVQYFNGTTLIGSSSTSPFAFEWSNAGEGTQVITIVATDSHGGITENSVTVNINTTTGLVSGNRYGLFTNVYPNPSTETFMIETGKGIKHIWVRNTYGVQVEEITDQFTGHSIEIGREFPEGTYVLMVEYISGKIEVAKIIKLK